MNTAETVLAMHEVTFTYPHAPSPVLDIEHFAIERGERVFIRGASGSGKTTLLSLIAAILEPQSGRIIVGDVDITAETAPQADQFRADQIGLVFQQFNLLPFLSVSENVQLPCRFSSLRRQQAIANGGSVSAEAQRLLDAMQLPKSAYTGSSAMQLSVGQQQRVAVARALIGSPKLIIADEPTSALDADARDAFLQLLFNEMQRTQASLLFVSHDASLAKQFDRDIDLHTLNQAQNQAQTTQGDPDGINVASHA